jgi:hypothetical protein
MVVVVLGDEYIILSVTVNNYDWRVMLNEL